MNLNFDESAFTANEGKQRFAAALAAFLRCTTYLTNVILFFSLCIVLQRHNVAKGGRKRRKNTGGDGEQRNIDVDKEIYDEKSLFRNKNDDGNNNFDRQTSKKRKEKVNYARANEINLDEENADQPFDFDEKQNDKYENVHTEANIQQLRAEMKSMLTGEEGKQLKSGIAAIVQQRKNNKKDINSTLETAKDLKDFLEKVQIDKDTSNFVDSQKNWLFSGDRNKNIDNNGNVVTGEINKTNTGKQRCAAAPQFLLMFLFLCCDATA